MREGAIWKGEEEKEEKEEEHEKDEEDEEEGEEDEEDGDGNSRTLPPIDPSAERQANLR